MVLWLFEHGQGHSEGRGQDKDDDKADGEMHANTSLAFFFLNNC